MFAIFSQQENLITVFKKYSVTEALKVKFNILQAIKTLNIPSDDLIEHMRNEGLCITDFSLGTDKSLSSYESSPSIIRAHLHKVFLDKQKLIDAMSGFSMSQAIEVRALLQNNMSQLKLPSDELISKMEQEGLSLQRIGIENTSPQSTVSSIKLAKTKKLLSWAIEETAEDKKRRIKSKLNALVQDVEKPKKLPTQLQKTESKNIKPLTEESQTSEVKKISLQEALERSLQTELSQSMNF